jgi:Tat protein translocase TatB subunit
MGSLTFSEILTILVIILIIFGPKRLPEFARKVGQFIAWGRRSMQEFTANVQREYGEDLQPLADLQQDFAGAKGDFTDAVKAVSGTMPPDEASPAEPSESSDAHDGETQSTGGTATPDEDEPL